MTAFQSPGHATFGFLLRRHRQAAGLSQEELASRTGLTSRAIGDMERGRSRRPYPRSVRMLADALALDGRLRTELLLSACAGQAAAAAAGHDAETVRESRSPAAPPASALPRQLPRGNAFFCHREAELATLSAQAALPVQAGSPAGVTLISGPAGIGKTTLALHWAHRAAGLFADGQLYVNLRGFDPADQPVPPSQAIRWFLDALGVPPARIPADLQAQAGLYRSLLADRSVLVVLDNAADAGQVRQLIPGGARCMTIITSRSSLPGLIASDAACSLRLDLLSDPHARELLALQLGPGRLIAEPEAVAELISVCAGLPLALAVTAALAATHPERSLAALVAEMRGTSRLDVLTTGDPATDMRAVLAASYRALSADAAEAFCLIGEHPGPEVTMAALASMAGTTPARAAVVAAELAQASLITEPLPGRFALHDLLGGYAAEQARACLPPAVRQAAVLRMLDHYTLTTLRAASLLDPAREMPDMDKAAAGTRPETPADATQASGWLEAEHYVLLNVISLASRTGWHVVASRLCYLLADFLDRRGYWQDYAAIQQSALAAARHMGAPIREAQVHRHLGRALFQLGESGQARGHLAQALALIGDDSTRRASLLLDLCRLDERDGKIDDAFALARLALELYEGAGHEVGEAWALAVVGWYHALSREVGEAIAACDSALASCQRLGLHWPECLCWRGLGRSHQQLGDSGQARACFQRALGICRATGERYLEACVLAELGDSYGSGGDSTQAERALREALQILTELGHEDRARVIAQLGSLPRTVQR